MQSDLQAGLWLRCFAVVALSLFMSWLLNQYVYPAFVEVCAPAREVATVGTSMGALATAFISLWRPKWIARMRYMKIALVLFGFGALFVIAGVVFENASLLVCASFIANAARASLVSSSFVVLVALGARQAATCIACAFVAAYVARAVGAILPEAVGVALWIVIPFLIARCAWVNVADVANRIGKYPAASALALTEPRSFLPYGHIVFVAFFIFELASGFSLTFNAYAGVPLFTMWPLLPLAIIAMQAVARREAGPSDALYMCAALLIVSGLLSLTVPPLRQTQIANGLLSAGSDCFNVLAYYVIAVLGRRNTLQSLAVSSWGHFLLTLGTLLGTSLGYSFTEWANRGGDGADLIAAIAVFLFVAFNMMAMRKFSFEGVIQSIEQVPDSVREKAQGDDGTDGAVARTAKRFGLTAREAEVLSYLARGRNVPFIEEELVISRNTIKTHIKHIYQKLNVHSQQELIDLIEIDRAKG